MDLWIRSQDKETLLKANKIKYEHYKPFLYDYYIEAIILNDVIVQEYETKERALEVLDEIQKMDFANNLNVELTTYGYVYIMPEE